MWPIIFFLIVGLQFDIIKRLLGANIAFDVAGVVFANMPKCEKEIYKFLASVTDLTEKDLRNMPPADFADIIINFFKKEELQDFMKVVSKFLK